MARQLPVPVLQEEKIVIHHNRLSKIILSILHIAAYQNNAVNSAVPFLYIYIYIKINDFHPSCRFTKGSLRMKILILNDSSISSLIYVVDSSMDFQHKRPLRFQLKAL